MKILKALMLMLTLTLSYNTLANQTPEEGRAVAAIGEDQNGCGPNSTCSECVDQSTLPPDSAVTVDETDDARAARARGQ